MQHEVIETRFLNDMAAALKEYGLQAHLSASDAIYSNLSWAGLNIENNSQLTASSKQRIESRLLDEQLDQPNGTEIPVGNQIGYKLISTHVLF
jgi:hypothetical protein